jgi:hypothetical protein
MSATGASTLWSQELQAHWPKSWRSLAHRDVLLEMFAPQVFNVSDDTLYIRYAEDQDLRISQYGLHLRILTLEPADKRTIEVFDKILHVIEPAKLNNIEASFSHIRPLDMEYDAARRALAQVFYDSWIRQRPVKDFALYWDEEFPPHGRGTFELGVVNQSELIDRIAQASGTSQDVLRRRTPAWMKVRMPQVAIFMGSHYMSKQEITPDLGRAQVPQMWREWRERSSLLFETLTDLAIPAQKGELS